MINEMDVLGMDERQRSAWLLANRATVMAVGLAWIGMIVWELAHDRSPIFLIAMVPVFALFRFGLYAYYLRATPADAGTGLSALVIRSAAAALLLTAAALPMFRVGDDTTAAWQLVRDDPQVFIPLGFAYLWPIAALLASRMLPGKRLAVVVHFGEPLLAAGSALIILWIPQLIFGFEESLLPWLWLPISTRPALGVHLAVAANGIYLIGWLIGLVRAAGRPG